MRCRELAARYGLPGLGIAALGEMTCAIRDVVQAVDPPCLVDADDGYGDIESAVRTIQSYELIGRSALPEKILSA